MERSLTKLSEENQAVEAAAAAIASSILDSNDKDTHLWVFGYGSLCWYPGFEYDKSVTGYVKGFSRRFWQGNTVHRGTESQPGRVATLVEDEKAVVWGRAFQIRGEAALDYLAQRECKSGGYVTAFAKFYPRITDHEASSSIGMQPFLAMLYVATPGNDLWVGEAPVRDIASKIVACRGRSGHNVEYVVRLADFLRTCGPEALDEHITALERHVLDLVNEQNLCLDTMMGDADCTALVASTQVPREADNPPNNAERRDSLPFSYNIPSKKLRCVNI